MRIKKLPKLLADQIAAGEVIERPASVVKELLENSLDAGAKHIQIDIDKGGLQLIRVSDDGYGIHQEDLALAVSRHATSKIYELKDLEQVASLGFRGEALASISSVSEFTLSSCPPQQTTAWQLNISGEEYSSKLQPCAHPTGTTIEVRNLFFNTPARRKFMRAEKTEFNHIEEIVRQLALSSYDVTIILRHNHQEILHLPAAKNELQIEKRIATLFSRTFIKQSACVDESAAGLRLWGWVSLPNFSRNQSNWQTIYVNGRFVKDRLLRHALRQAYEHHLPPGRQAAYLLYLELDPADVDVNVHPCKYEVRFRDIRSVHDFIYSVINKAVHSDKEAVIFPEKIISDKYVREPVPTYEHSNNSIQTISQDFSDNPLTENLLAILKDRYLLVEKEQTVFLLDLQAAFQHIAAKQLTQDLRQNTIHRKPLLIPKTLILSNEAIQFYLRNADVFQSIGILLEQLTPLSLIVREVPVLLPNIQFDNLFSALKNACDPQQLLLLCTQYHDYLPQKPLKLAKIEPLLMELYGSLKETLFSEHYNFCKPLMFEEILQ